eukprot:763991-Hanusia_phi.AAC.1
MQRAALYGEGAALASMQQLRNFASLKMSFRNEQALCRLRSIGEENDFGVEMHLLDDVLTTAVDADTLNRSPDEDSEVCFHQEVSEASAETLKGKHGTRMSTSATASVWHHGEKHEATHMGFGGWEVKPWSFLRECNAELVTAGSSMTRSFVDRETVGSSEWMRVWMAYLAVKETALRSLHLDILKSDVMEQDPQKLANLCSHVEEIFFRTGQNELMHEQQVLVCLRAQKETLTEVARFSSLICLPDLVNKVMQQTEEGVPSVGCRQRDRGKEAWLELQERFPFLPDTELLRKQTGVTCGSEGC